MADSGELEVGATVEPETSVMFEIGRKLIRLYLCENHSCETCLEDFDYIDSMNGDYPKNVTERLLQIGFMELVQHILRRFLKTAVTEADNDSPSACLSAILSACGTVIDMTDHSSEACRKVIQLELHIDIINLLKSDHVDPTQTDQGLSDNHCRLVKKLMLVLYNVVQLTIEARELYREQGILEVIQRFQTGTTNSLCCLAFMFLAWVINDEENSILNSSDEVFSLLNRELRSSLAEVLHRSHLGYKAVELLAAINKLAVNDENKERIAKSGALSSYVEFLEPLMDEEEQFLAAQGLWTLAFKCAEEIRQEKSCIERLEMLSKKSEDDRVRSHVNGALIALGVKQENPIQASKEGLASEAEEKRKRIFISYQHSSTETVVKIRGRLRDHGYMVWMDADDICGSIAEDITDGIDTSSIVLTCLSQKYYESPYCKKEVIYADQNQKEIIPLTMEPKYTPHGWLSFRMTDKLRIDSSKPESFEASLRILLQKIKKSFDEVNSGSLNNQPKVVTLSSHVPTIDMDVNGSGATCEPELVLKKTCSLIYSASPAAGVFSWTKEDVKEWLEKNNMQQLMSWFDDYDGRLLLEFQSVLEKSPELVAPSFIATHSVKDFLQLTMALRKLH